MKTKDRVEIRGHRNGDGTYSAAGHLNGEKLSDFVLERGGARELQDLWLHLRFVREDVNPEVPAHLEHALPVMWQEQFSLN
jgi:hypothetical protein